MISGKDIWFEAWDKYYAKCDDWMQDIKNDDMTEYHYHDMCNRAHAAGMTLEEHATYWNRTLAYYQAQPDDSSE